MNTLTAINQLYYDYITRLDGDSEESAAALRECRAELLKLKPREPPERNRTAPTTRFSITALSSAARVL